MKVIIDNGYSPEDRVEIKPFYAEDEQGNDVDLVEGYFITIQYDAEYATANLTPLQLLKLRDMCNQLLEQA